MKKKLAKLQDSVNRKALLAGMPTDHALLKQAEVAMGHISEKAVMDEYYALVQAKHFRRPRRSIWSRLFDW